MDSAIGMAVLAIGVGAWSDRMVRAGRDVTLSRVFALQAVACLAPLVFVIPLVSSVPMAILLFTLVQVMCLSWLTLSNVLLTSLFDKSAVATAAGVLNALGTVGAAIFNFFAGTIVQEFGYGTIFAMAAFRIPSRRSSCISFTAAANRARRTRPKWTGSPPDRLSRNSHTDPSRSATDFSCAPHRG